MSSEDDGGGWGGIIGAASRKEVWQGRLVVSKTPRITVWWKAWADTSGHGMDLLHVGVTGRVDSRVREDDLMSLTHKTLGGIVQMAWNTVGRDLNIETQRVQANSYDGVVLMTGRVSIKAYSGKDFDPLMAAIQRMKEVVESDAEKD